MFFSGWWMIIIIVIAFAFGFYSQLNRRIKALKRDVTNLQSELVLVQNIVEQLKKADRAVNRAVNKAVDKPVAKNFEQPSKQPSSLYPESKNNTAQTAQTVEPPYVPNWQPDSTAQAFKPKSPSASKPPSNISASDNTFLNSSLDVEANTDSPASESEPASTPTIKPFPTAKAPLSTSMLAKSTAVTKPAIAEPDERSLPVVTSLLESAKNWFLGGNLVVRVGVIVLLIGVVLLLRLVNDYIEIPIEVKLLTIGIVGLGMAGLGLKLIKKRFAYGITMQGAGLAIAYLSSFFAYRVYHVLPSLPSFVLLGVLSLITVGLAVRQNAFPLALLAFSGAFLAPILTSDDTGSLTTLFGYYLLLNVGVAVIAHYRTWKVLNLLGAGVTFALAYYWGFSSLDDGIADQRWSLSIIVGLHWLLYLFVAIRYAQQILAYNATITTTDILNEVDVMGRKMLFPIDTGLMFATPLLAFGLISVLLADIEHALSVVSAIMATTYISVGWMLIKRSRHHALLSEGLLALGFGFLALIVPLELDAEWVSFGWSVQGLALVWFGRRSLRAWAVVFGITLQIIAVFSLLLDALQYYDTDVSLLVLSISAISFMVSMFVLRAANSPIDSTSAQDKALLPFVDNQSVAFNLVWRMPALITILTLGGMLWTALITVSLIDAMVDVDTLTDAGCMSLIILSNMAIYWLINRYRYWQEVSWLTHGWFIVYCLSFIGLLPESYTVHSAYATIDINNLSINWFEFLPLLLGWLVIGQLWIKEWVQDYQKGHQNAAQSTTLSNTKYLAKISLLIDYIQPTLWLGSIVIIIAQLAHYLLPNSDDVMTVLITSVSLLVIITLAKHLLTAITPWFDWRGALIGTGIFFAPLIFGWAVISNAYHDGVVWGLAYIPMLNLYDITVLLALAYGATLYNVYVSKTYAGKAQQQNKQSTAMLCGAMLIRGIGAGVGIWIISSILVRTLHTYAGTPLWVNGALLNDKVQICLTIFWSVTLLLSAYKLPRVMPSFDWHKAIVASSYVFIPFMFVWVISSNWYYDGEVWGLPYIPALNLYDIAIFLALAYGLRVHYLSLNMKHLSRNNILLKAVGIISFWVLFSILVRTLHTYVGTPLWSEGAWGNDKVQTGLTILWTLTALVATVMSSRNGKRFWWFMGVGLLGAVVFKLVLVDLSQTGNILRVVSFIGAGGLMMLIGYFAPLPPEDEDPNKKYNEEDINDGDSVD